MLRERTIVSSGGSYGTNPKNEKKNRWEGAVQKSYRCK